MKYKVNSKRRKQKRLKVLIFIILITIIISGIFIYKHYKKEDKDIPKNSTQYNEEVFQLLQEKNIYNDIKDKDYSKTLEEVLLNNKFKEEYLNEYLSIEYKNKDNFIDNINILLDKSYKSNEINNIYKLSDKNINKLLSIDYLNIKDYYKLSNFDVDNYSRYENYKDKNKDITLDKVVTYVNVNLDYEFYTNTKRIENQHDLLILVNKYNYLDKDFVPKNLVGLSNKKSAKMVKVAADAYENLIIGALSDNNLSICATSAYRDYNWQKSLYDGYVSKNGKAKADTYSARPGYSEHQTGLAVDIMNTKNYGTGTRLSKSDYNWLKNNVHKYGFIIRYPENVTNITGYINETWHLRYVGVDIATDIFNKKLTFEEYYDLYIKEN